MLSSFTIFYHSDLPTFFIFINAFRNAFKPFLIVVAHQDKRLILLQP